MVSSLEIHSSRALERQRCMVEWVGRGKGDEAEIELDYAYEWIGQRPCSDIYGRKIIRSSGEVA